MTTPYRSTLVSTSRGRQEWSPRALLPFFLLFGLLLQTGPAASATLPRYDRVRVLEAAEPLQDMTLTDSDGHPFQLSQLRGKVALVFFGFTNCPDVCPVAMAKLQELHSSGRVDVDRVAFVMISVDGERDTPEALKNYLSGFPRAFIGLTGDPQDVKKVAARFRAPFYKGSSGGNGDNYTVAHSPQVFAVDPAGRLRAEFYNASLEAMAGTVVALIDENDGDAEEVASWKSQGH